MLALWLSLAWASPTTVVAVGEGVVVGGPNGPEATSGWVSGVGDCLREAEPRRYTVLDRQGPRARAQQVNGWLDGIQKERRVALVVAAGWFEGTSPFTKTDVEELLGGLRSAANPPDMVFVVSPLASPSMPSAAEGAGLVSSMRPAGVTLVDLGLVTSEQRRASMWAAGNQLSAQGHAAVAATVCDALRAWNDAPVESP